jgi:hypothetical protein
MEYKLYTLVDITHTKQHRAEPGKENLRWKEQNFQTVLQTLGIRANVSYYLDPEIIETKGRVAGFDTDELVRVWRFDFYTEHDYLFEKDGDPVGHLKEDFEMVPYISGLDEAMEQNYAVFVTDGPSKNIIFQVKQ